MGEKIVSPKRAAVAALLLAGALALLALALMLPSPSYATGAKASSGAPHARRRGQITGTLEDGRLLSVSEGSWTGATPMSFTYQWETCQRDVCTPIPNATEATYRATSPDVRHRLRVLVSATNSLGTTSKLSRASKKIKEGSPLSLAAPEITGTAIEAAKLTASTGTWVGTAPFQFSYQWERCSLSGGGCTPIEGATEVSYTPGAADLASRLTVTVSASNIVGKASATSLETLPIEALLPVNILSPTITGGLLEGDLLSVDPGLWEGTEPISFSYVWELCDALGKSCSEIKSASEPSLTLLTSYIGDTIESVVTATNVAGESSATSSLSGLIKGIVPLNSSTPSITGGLLEGDLLSVNPGLWEGTEPISFSYVWELCDALGKSCGEIKGASEPSLTLLPSYIGDTLESVVTAKNVAGESSATSSLSGIIKGIAPLNESAPSLSGGQIEGDLLKLTSGTWSGTEPISYTYGWELCNALGKACSEIKGASEPSLILLAGYIGDTLEGVVIAHNVAGEASATSSLSGIIKGIAPLNESAPSLTGGVVEGDALKLTSGSWTGTQPISYTYGWELCNALGKACSEIKGASEPSLILLAGYIGDTLEGVVIAHNVAGEASATSSLSGIIKGIAPLNESAPSLTGGVVEGDALKLTSGSWTGTQPISYTYGWELCNALGKACSEIKGASEPSLILLAGYIGDTLEGVVIAHNVAGEASATSSLSGIIKGIAPLNESAPSLTGGVVEGDALKLTSGSWTGTQPISYTYGWELCNALGKACSEIKGASEPSLILLAGYIGDTLEGVVIADNVAGEASATSSLSGIIKGIAPLNESAPSLTGGVVEGDALKLTSGSWTGTQPISYTYGWELCNALGKACSEIKGASEPSLTLLAGYIGDTLEGVVIADNVAGEASATSSPTDVIKGIAPANTKLPSITGTLSDGQLLTASTGTWTGTEPITYSYQWQLCTLLTKVCSPISGAMGSTLKLGLEDVGKLLEVVVSAKNVAGSSAATSLLTGEVLL